MTTPNTDLAEQIETALLEVLGAIEEQGHKTVWLADRFIDPADLSAAVLPHVEEHARAAAKAAWDQCAEEQGTWPRPQGDPRALTYVLLANNPYMPQETPDEQ